ncbi:MAG: chemotaxis protein CheX [candidate division Zixibacteria bacterium]|nr:chemotaxis protein CheX [Candidatus Tariuqbacter arcticus]
MGKPVGQINSDVQDKVGELANIVAGGAKEIFSKSGLSLHISIPTVVVGKNHVITHKFDVPLVIVPFMLGSSPFSMEISLKIGAKESRLNKKSPNR